VWFLMKFQNQHGDTCEIKGNGTIQVDCGFFIIIMEVICIDSKVVIVKDPKIDETYTATEMQIVKIP